MANVVGLKEVNKSQSSLVGEKASLLGEISEIVLVPKGFVVKNTAFQKFIEPHQELIESVLEKGQDRVRSLINSFDIPQELRNEISTSYTKLGNPGQDNAFELVNSQQSTVAVRCSLFVEKNHISSTTEMPVVGDENILNAVKRCWGILISEQLDLVRDTGISSIKIYVLIQNFVYPHKSALCYTVNPDNGQDERLIEACWGLCDYFVLDEREPHKYVIDKPSNKIKEKKSEEQEYAYIFNKSTGEKEKKTIPEPERSIPVLKESEVENLSEIANRIEKHMDGPVEIEFVIESDKIFVIQVNTICEPEEEVYVYGNVYSVYDNEKVENEDPQNRDLQETGEDLNKTEGELMEVEELEETEEDPLETATDFENKVEGIIKKYTIINPELKDVLELLKKEILDIK